MSNKATLKRGGITAEKAAILGKKGGIASGKAKREKKLMSAILADYLARQKGYDSFDKYIDRVLKRGDSSTVSMIKTFADVIEGSKIKTETVLTINADDEKVQQVLKEFGVNKSETKD